MDTAIVLETYAKLVGEALTAVFLTGTVLRRVGLRLDRRALLPVVRFALPLLPGESIIGFLYTGTVASEKPSVPRPDTKEYVSRWAAPGRTSPWQV